MFKRGKRNWFLRVDLLGSPSFIEKTSPLYGVGRFKWSLWGKQIEYLGSYDLIFNQNLYQIFKLKKQLNS
jgi:lipid II:glycine glycyltransferase (peptidoglycan interpeptide bridge formation enzyme)